MNRKSGSCSEGAIFIIMVIVFSPLIIVAILPFVLGLLWSCFLYCLLHFILPIVVLSIPAYYLFTFFIDPLHAKIVKKNLTNKKIVIDKETNWEHWSWKEILPVCVFLAVLWLISITLGFLCSILYIGLLFQTWSQPELEKAEPTEEMAGFVYQIVNESTIVFRKLPFEPSVFSIKRKLYYRSKQQVVVVEGIDTSELVGGYNYAANCICFSGMLLGLKIYPDDQTGMLHYKIVGDYRYLTEKDWS